MAGRLYRTRAHATLVVAGNNDGTVATRIELTPRSVKLVRNDHNHADECRLTVDWIDAGVDPRLLAGCQAKVYIGEADDFGVWSPDDDTNLQFVGILTRARRSSGGDDRTIELEFLDYTALFLRFKPFPQRGVPRFDNNLKQAWSVLLSGFTDRSTYQNEIKFLLNAIEFRGLPSPGPVLGDAVAQRFRTKGAQLQVGTNVDAWAAWQHVVGSVGLMSYFDLDKLVVATSDAHYGGGTGSDPPRLVHGINIDELSEERDNSFERKGVGISSYDPETGKTIEAVWPPETKTTKGKAKAKKGQPAPEVRGIDWFSPPGGGSDPDTLLKIAKRVYDERARQEFTGRGTTHEMLLERAGGGTFPTLDLRSGDSIQILLDEFEANGATVLDAYPDQSQRQKYFETLGYDSQIAGLMAQRASDLLTLRGEFHVKTVSVSLESTPEGGSFDVEIEYINKIQSTGDATEDL